MDQISSRIDYIDVVGNDDMAADRALMWKVAMTLLPHGCYMDNDMASSKWVHLGPFAYDPIKVLLIKKVGPFYMGH